MRVSPWRRWAGVEGLIAGGFERGEIGVELAGGNFLRRGGGVAELAVGEILFGRTHRGTERPAEDGAR